MKKGKHTLTTLKIICIVFWDRQGVLLEDFLPRGQTINKNATVRRL